MRLPSKYILVYRQSSGSHQAVIRQSPFCHKNSFAFIGGNFTGRAASSNTVYRCCLVLLSFDFEAMLARSHQAVNRQSGSHQEVIRQSLCSHQVVIR